ncbi:MAG: ATP-dependent Clp protease proteolytic subunit [Ignavibacteria bacterium]|nr:ATP-dependent Clp protease proteolytic subunit [Ignavibacteria bacterium]
MKNFLIITIFISGIFTSLFSQNQKKVYLIDISGDIDLGLAPYVERVVKEAEEKNADAIILKVNTFGGRVDAATQIRDAIIKSKILTIAFIDKRAISAGALISISAKKIVMSPGSTIGASTVVDQEGTKASEKYQSYMRSEMRSTAERNGRRPDIAEAMVDERIVIKDFPELDDSTKLLTLTTEEATKVGYCDFVASNIDELLEHFNLKGAEIISTEVNWAENIVRFLSNPIVSSLLIMLGILGLLTEIKTPGWGVAGTIGLISLALFFGTSYILQLANIWEILIFIIGLALLLIEIFYVPGFGLIGILGIILMIGSIFFGLIGDFPVISENEISNALIQLAAALVASIIFLFIIWKFLPSVPIWGRLILSTSENQTEGFISNPDFSHLLGKRGKALTQLRPAGIALIDNKRYDVMTEGEFISKDEEIEVIEVVGSKIIVKKIS